MQNLDTTFLRSTSTPLFLLHNATTTTALIPLQNPTASAESPPPPWKVSSKTLPLPISHPSAPADKDDCLLLKLKSEVEASAIMLENLAKLMAGHDKEDVHGIKKRKFFVYLLTKILLIG